MNDDFATTWSAYVRRHLDAYPGITTEQVGDAIDASATMVGNWIAARGFKQASADKVVAFWREFGGDSTLPEAMAAAGYASVEEFDTVVRTKPDLDMVEPDELLDWMRRRIETPPFSRGDEHEGGDEDGKPA